MRFMYLVKHPGRSGNPTPELMEAMGKLADREIKAGRMLDCGGVLTLQARAHVRIADAKLKGIDGPVVEAKEGVGAYASFVSLAQPGTPGSAKRIMQRH